LPPSSSLSPRKQHIGVAQIEDARRPAHAVGLVDAGVPHIDPRRPADVHLQIRQAGRGVVARRLLLTAIGVRRRTSSAGDVLADGRERKYLCLWSARNTNPVAAVGPPVRLAPVGNSGSAHMSGPYTRAIEVPSGYRQPARSLLSPLGRARSWPLRVVARRAAGEVADRPTPSTPRFRRWDGRSGYRPVSSEILTSERSRGLLRRFGQGCAQRSGTSRHQA
jgi:hypothetical protein